MATRLGDGGVQGVSVGRVLSNAFGTIGSNPLTTLGMAFLSGTLPTMLFNGAIGGLRPTAATAMGVSGFVALGLVGVVVVFVAAVLAQGALVRATIAHAEGRRASIGECAAAGLRVLVPLFALSLLIGVAVTIGMVLLIVPGVLLYMVWAVASPALVTEGIGIGAALDRSAQLTKGARWKVFALTLGILGVYYFAGGVTAALQVTAAGGLATFGSMAQQGAPAWTYVLNGIVQTVMTAVWSTAQTALYVDLRAWKEGPAGGSLAEIFA